VQNLKKRKDQKHDYKIMRYIGYQTMTVAPRVGAWVETAQIGQSVFSLRGGLKCGQGRSGDLWLTGKIGSIRAARVAQVGEYKPASLKGRVGG
jgi:hypothetical protein